MRLHQEQVVHSTPFYTDSTMFNLQTLQNLTNIQGGGNATVAVDFEVKMWGYYATGQPGEATWQSMETGGANENTWQDLET